MRHAYILTSERIGLLRRTERIAAVAPTDDPCLLRTLVRSGCQFPAARCPQRIVVDDLCHNAGNNGGLLLHIATNDGVPVATMHQLYPQHIELCEGGATPLTRLAKNDVYGATTQPQTLHCLQIESLGTIECEGNIPATTLVRNHSHGLCPIFKIIFYTFATEFEPQRNNVTMPR